MASTTSLIGRRVERPSPPTWVKPQLATLVKEAPDGPDWLHEIKLDGYRMARPARRWTGANPDAPRQRLDRQIPRHRQGNCPTTGAECLSGWRTLWIASRWQD